MNIYTVTYETESGQITSMEVLAVNSTVARLRAQQELDRDAPGARVTSVMLKG